MDIVLQSGASMFELRKFLRRLHYGVNPILVMALMAMVFFSLSRIALSIWQWDVIPEGTFHIVLLQGIRVDFASVCGLFALPFLVLTLASLNPYVRVPRIIPFIISIYCALGFAFIVLNELATPGFIMEYGVRPNQIYVQYIKYLKELTATLWGGHKLELFATIIGTGIALYVGFRVSSFLLRNYRQGSFTYSAIALVLTICIVPLGIRSTLGHRPLNPAMVSFSNNSLANSLPVNSSYSAIYHYLHLDDLTITEDQLYARVEAPEALAHIDELSARTNAQPFNEQCPINQHITPFRGVYTGKPGQPGTTADAGDAAAAGAGSASGVASADAARTYNVVIILEESLGDNFVESQGGFPMTPYLEKLRDKGWWFENMYAAGTRSIRGIEAVTASYPPSALQSIVKLAQPGYAYASLAQVFRQAGYKTSFIYGGESHFDNMRTYFYNNGVEHIVEQKDYDNPSFVAAWGVSDEDLFNKANETFKEIHARGERFFSVVFSSSFHDPFDIPAGKVSLDGFENPEPARLLAAKYADYAMGTYLEKAASEDYYKDTVFLVIADHESRVYGSEIFPLNDFAIPAVIIAPNVKPHTDKRIVSQIDMGPTLMSLAGLDVVTPNVGQNLTRNDTKNRAIMQINNNFGLLEGDDLVEIAPYAQPYFYKVGKDLQLTAIDKEKAAETHYQEMLRRAISYSNLGHNIYSHGYMNSACVTLNQQGQSEDKSSVPASAEAQTTAQAADAAAAGAAAEQDSEPESATEADKASKAPAA
ncbi:LTA synthase family protein [Anaerobiospirillum sp. NML120449]|uniref:LTA synthase family protein n=1 Tax=Anaerobiospirillum sp. NML120449 TaxID=2932817 RepID=UPI001FF0F9AA|nr:LTA synthase family protein [Anaerobiospirillum sp. NML120449]